MRSIPKAPEAGAGAGRPRIRVAVVIANWHGGGAQRVVLTLANQLDRNRFSPEVIVVDDDGPLRDWIAADIPVHTLGHLRVRECLGPLRRKLGALNPDVVFSTQPHLNFAVLMLKPFLRRHTRFMVRESNTLSSFTGSLSRWGRWLIPLAYRALYRLADSVICPAQGMADELASAFPKLEPRLSCLRNPVDEERIRSDLHLLPGSAERERTIRFVAVGRCHRQKGYDRLIAALPELDIASDWRLDIYGEGPEKEPLQALVRQLGLETRVHFAGFIRNPWREVAAADCLVLPSRWEGLPNVVLESLACGTPVIAHREAGGIQEIASLAAPGAITVVEDMNGFLEAMRTVRVSPTTRFRPSLLPGDFRLGSVMHRFEQLLS